MNVFDHNHKQLIMRDNFPVFPLLTLIAQGARAATSSHGKGPNGTAEGGAREASRWERGNPFVRGLLVRIVAMSNGFVQSSSISRSWNAATLATARGRSENTGAWPLLATEREATIEIEFWASSKKSADGGAKEARSQAASCRGHRRLRWPRQTAAQRGARGAEAAAAGCTRAAAASGRRARRGGCCCGGFGAGAGGFDSAGGDGIPAEAWQAPTIIRAGDAES